MITQFEQCWGLMQKFIKKIEMNVFNKHLAQCFFESCSFSCYFPDTSTGFIYDKDKRIIGIENRVGNNHALCSNVGSLVKILDYGYGIKFFKSLYKRDDIDIASARNSNILIL